MVTVTRGYGLAKSDYQRYLQSGAWKAKRRLVRKRSNGTCELCKKRIATQAHHVTYENLGDEPLDDLLDLCFVCHAKQHPEKRGFLKGAHEAALKTKARRRTRQRDYHEGKRKVLCPLCRMTFARNGLKSHMIAKHDDGRVTLEELEVERREAEWRRVQQMR